MAEDKASLPKAIICIDFSNYHYYLNKKKWRIDWKQFVGFFSSFYAIEGVFYYEGIPSKAVYFDLNKGKTVQDFITATKAKEGFHKSLKRVGIKVCTKSVGRVYDNTEGCYKHKCNFDVELTIDAIENLAKVDTFILCSGDGDFTKLVKYVKGRFKKAIVVAPSDRLSGTLENAANQVIYLEDIRDEIEQR